METAERDPAVTDMTVGFSRLMERSGDTSAAMRASLQIWRNSAVENLALL